MNAMRQIKHNSEYMELVAQFPLVPIRSKQHFQEAVKVMKDLAYCRAALSEEASDYLSVLGDLIAKYENDLPQLAPDMTPREVVTYLMEINGLTQADLVPLVGYKSNLSAFLKGKRGLSKTAIMRLAEKFNVSPVIFL